MPSPSTGWPSSNRADSESSLLLIGADDVGWIAKFLLGLSFDFVVETPEELRGELAAIGCDSLPDITAEPDGWFGTVSTMATTRKAIVTGAASGIGRAIAQRLVEEGHEVLSVDLVPDMNGPGHGFAADLRTRSGNEASVSAAVEMFGGVDLVVPCAGFQHVSPVAEFAEDRWDALVDVLLTSPFLLAKYAWEHLAASGTGHIVVVASIHGLVASPFKAGYVAAKHGVIGLTKVLALEGADVGIRAVALCPGYVRTPLVEGQIPGQAVAHSMAEDDVLREVILAPHAVKELIEPEEVADTVSFLLTPAGRAFTGVALPMDMGWSAR